MKLSGLPHHKTLEEFDFAFQPDLDARKVRDLATLEFVRAKSNVALLGPPGVGKTMIAVALAVAACQAGFSIYFTTLDDLVRKLRAAEATGRFNRQLAASLRPAVLVVDEVGYLPLDQAEANMVFQLVSRPLRTRLDDHHQHKAFTEWGSVLGDDVLATAILDRLLHHCDVLAINGPSYRLKDRLTLVTGGEPMPCSPHRDRHVRPYPDRHMRSYPDTSRNCEPNGSTEAPTGSRVTACGFLLGDHRRPTQGVRAIGGHFNKRGPTFAPLSVRATRRLQTTSGNLCDQALGWVGYRSPVRQAEVRHHF